MNPGMKQGDPWPWMESYFIVGRRKKIREKGKEGRKNGRKGEREEGREGKVGLSTDRSHSLPHPFLFHTPSHP